MTSRMIASLIAACGLCCALSGFTVVGSDGAHPQPTDRSDPPTTQTVLPNVTDSGYLTVDAAANASLYFTYYEAQQAATDETPLVLWLQVCWRLLNETAV